MVKTNLQRQFGPLVMYFTKWKIELQFFVVEWRDTLKFLLATVLLHDLRVNQSDR